jgi:hypothetical protein
VFEKWRNIGQCGGAGADLRPVGGAPIEFCFTMSRAGGMGV